MSQKQPKIEMACFLLQQTKLENDPPWYLYLSCQSAPAMCLPDHREDTAGTHPCVIAFAVCLHQNSGYHFDSHRTSWLVSRDSRAVPAARARPTHIDGPMACGSSECLCLRHDPLMFHPAPGSRKACSLFLACHQRPLSSMELIDIWEGSSSEFQWSERGTLLQCHTGESVTGCRCRSLGPSHFRPIFRLVSTHTQRPG